MIKKILTCLALVLIPFVAHATTAQFGMRLLYTSTNVTTTGYTQLIAKAPYPCNRAIAFDSSGQTLQIGIGVSGSEVFQIYIPPGGTDSPVSINTNDRVAIIALSGTATVGEIDINCTF